ncbi:MAG TPA: DUF3857 domain-containing transglutaminase family protein [Candidatus Saccharimonadales bacterium]|jgi:hypothetical protein|nr:DUF3857 domain-containing transglutaminase family protein [Candidatus Saccharimonadales bacterium]
MLKKRISVALLGVILGFCSVAADAASIPDWLRNAARQTAKKYADDVNAVVLMDFRETTVKDNTDIVTHGWIAYRILRPEGKNIAQYEIAYSDETKVRYLRGWSITAQGQEYEVKEKDAFERSLSTYEIYSDAKEKILVVPGADVGSVVGFEYERKGRPLVFQEDWSFQDRLPREKMRFELRLPSRWEFRAEWINYPAQAPVEQNGVYSWELTDIPRIDAEYRRPPVEALSGRMVLTFFSDKIRSQTYRTWNDLGLWYGQISAGSRDSSPALQQKVQELAPAGRPLLERVRALARFAQQDVRYAAIEIGIGGFRPHQASETFSHRYGDCKDKANVLSAMLAQIGVKSYLMPIHTQRGIFTEKSPPDLGFDHAIIAIQLPDASLPGPLSALYLHPKLGQLLIFDPTNDLVPFGQLPYYEQDSYALLVTDSGGELIHLPVSRPEVNSIKRTAKLKLSPDGTLKGEVEEVRSGYHAMEIRGRLKDESEQDRKKFIERAILGPAMGSFQLDGLTLENENDIEKDFIVRYKFTAEHYAKSAGPLLLVRPRVVGEKSGYLDFNKPRRYAYELEAPKLDNDVVEISLPDGFKVDELPDPAKASYPFGEYHSATEVEGNMLRYKREFRMNGTLVPLEKAGQLKLLFSAINVDEKSVAVLKRAN